MLVHSRHSSILVSADLTFLLSNFPFRHVDRSRTLLAEAYLGRRHGAPQQRYYVADPTYMY